MIPDRLGALRERIELLRRDYRAALPDRLGAIEAAALEAGGGDACQLETLYLLAHSLTGSAAIYGLPALSQAAAALEAYVKATLAEGIEARADTLRPRLAALLRALRHAAAAREPSEPPATA